MTSYAILLIGDENAWEAGSDQDKADAFAHHEEFGRALAARGHTVTGGAELTHSRTARTVRSRPDGSLTVTDGPYAEAAEQVGGYYVVESDDLDDLVRACEILARAGDVVEVRTQVDHDGGDSGDTDA